MVLLAFALPFATVSCDTDETTFTGAQLATWSVPEGGQLDARNCRDDIAGCVEREGSLLAGVVAVAALAGIVLGLWRTPKGEGWCAAAGLVAILLLTAQALRPRAVDVSLHSGFWVILALLLWATALHAARRLRRRQGPA
jgi:hypothetical protein